jgi:hypothetical protein
MTDFLQHYLLLVLAFGFGLAGSLIYTFGPLSDMKLLSPIQDKHRASYGLAVIFVVLAIICMALQIYSAGKPA